MESSISNDKLAELYVTPGHPIAFSSPNAIYRFFNGNVPLEQIKNVLHSISAYTLHREIRKPRIHNPFYAYRRRENFQADLIDMKALKFVNRHFSFLLVIIDVFTRKIWVMPLKKKSAAITRDAIQAWIEILEKDSMPLHKPRHLFTDRGTKFLNRDVATLLKKNNFILSTSNQGKNKAAIAERVNKTLQMKMYKWMQHTGKGNYISVLPDIVSTYNNGQHRTLEFMTPNDADLPENEDKVRSIHSRRYGKIWNKTKNQRKNVPFKLGDIVHVKLDNTKKVGKNARAYTEFFTSDYFIIIRIQNRMPVVTYQVQSLKTGKILPGSFYANDITQTKSKMFKIDRILKSRKTMGYTEKLVRLVGLHPTFDSWVKESDIDQNRRIHQSQIDIPLDPTLIKDE